MTDQKFHIIAFDVPYPPNYGGIVDVFYKLKTLHAVGGKIIYHCFYYPGHNQPHEELAKYCEEIYYYPRMKKIGKLIFSRLPYVVSSRDNKAILDRLLKDNYPIIYDGIQTAYWMNHPKLKGRIQLFRANNIEHAYYYGLAKWETSFFKKIYLKIEANRLQRFEQNIRGVDGILCVAKMDIPHFEQYAPTHHIPPFFHSDPNFDFDPEEAIEQVLFQGNLSVKENEHAAFYIVNHIAPLTDSPIVIAGKNPSERLKTHINSVNLSNVRLIDTPSIPEMDNLIKHSRVNLLLTFQQTGIKLKLLHALESGQHIIINDKMDDSGIFSAMCHTHNAPEEIAAKIDTLIAEPFTQAIKQKRDKQFAEYYNNKKNARNILALMGY